MAKEKIALVTGANKGIGLEIARELAEKDFRVFLAARDPQRGTSAASALRKSGARVEFLQLDVADLKTIKRAAKEFSAQADHLDVLVNNAGIYEDRGASILDIDPEVVRTTLQTNTLGPMLMTQQFWQLLAKSGSGRVINLSSGMGALHDMGGGSPAYSISKTALNAVTRQFAAELKDKGITVNSVCPGWVHTDMGGAGAPRTPQQGADTVIWLATEAPTD
ncbi:MAG TPA: SDR family NAD(P)-dependent oxidoreductase, partial [Verrucomicrobiae bacterium]|nr:SDR family NAD(P)-dependent oxidoreductase [Verrucomicrobiae bacterium]